MGTAALSTVVVRIQGDTGHLVSSLTVAEKRTTGFLAQLSRVGASGTAQARGFSNLARGFTNAAGQSGVLNSEISILASSVGNVGLTAAAAGIGMGLFVGGLAASVGAAISFETAVTKVAKTANFSASETKAFGDEILDMSRRLPVATSALTDIAVVAGQLGISGLQNISAFTEEVAKLASTTGVDAGMLATQLGQIAQITNTPITAIGGFSSALTQLGNDFNSTEGQILDFTTRIAGVGNVVGLSAVQLAAISNAFASVGVEAERGGTAVQRVLISMQSAAVQGGKELDAFAKVTGLTAEAFKSLAKSNPQEAFTRFVEGLKNSGNQAVTVLDDLGLADARLTAAFLSVAAAGPLLRNSFDTATDAAAKGTATNDEFARSSQTTAAQIQLLKNNLNVLAVNVGTVLLPSVNQAVGGITALTQGVGAAGPATKLLATATGDLVKVLVVLGATMAAIKIGAFVSEAVAGRVALQAALGGMQTGAPVGVGGAGIGALGAVITRVNPVMAAVTALTVGTIALDAAMQHFRGEGLLSFLTGAKEKAEAAEKATKDLAAAMQVLQNLQEIGGVGGGASAFFDQQLQAVKVLSSAVDDLQSKQDAYAGRHLDRPTFDLLKTTEAQLKTAQDAIKKALAEAPADQKAGFVIRLKLAIDGDPELMKIFKGSIDEANGATRSWNVSTDEATNNLLRMDPATRTAAEGIARLKSAIDGVNEATKTYAEIVSDAASAVIPKAQTDPIVANLELAIAKAEDLKNRLGGDWTEDQQAGLDQLNTQLDGYRDSWKLVSAEITAGGANYLAWTKASATAMAQSNVSAAQWANTIGGVSTVGIVNVQGAIEAAATNFDAFRYALESLNGTEIYTDIVTRLPLLQMEEWAQFFAQWDGSAINIDVVLSGIESARQALQSLVSGGGPINMATAFEAEARGISVFDRTPVVQYKSQSSGGGGGRAHVLTALEAAMDGVITRTEALTLGLTDQEVIALDLAVASNKVADEEFRRRIGLQALAQAYPGLTGAEVQFRIGLAAIADHLARTGETIQKFILDTSTAALAGFQSAFDAIFNKPTKEDSALKLQLDQAKRKLLLSPGASDAEKKRMQVVVDNLQDLLDIRRNARDIKADEAATADKSALSDQAQWAAADLLITAIGTTSQQVEDMGGQVFLQTMAQMGLTGRVLEATTAVANFTDVLHNSTAKQWTAAEKAFITQVAINKGEMPPSFAVGSSFVPRDMTARIHRGEQIIPAGESGQPINITSYITVEGDATEKTVAMIKKAVREEAETALRRASFRGSYVTSGAYTPS